MTLAAVFLGAALLALIVLLDRMDKRLREERKSWQLERANLLQRIQAPEIAVVDHSNEGQPLDPQAVSIDDDADYWEDWAEKAERLMAEERERLSRGA